MRNAALLIASLEYIEEHLGDDVKTEDVAIACFCAKSTLEKMFRRFCHISVHDYITRRRMMGAAKRLTNAPEESILDIAVAYGYNTHESFTRAFKQVWNCKPSEFRKGKYMELFPRYRIPLENGDEIMMERKRVDISELYDLFQERRECFFVCCDIKHLIPINEISHKAGDMAILETMNRMREASGQEDVVFRIGGDEFCILTDSREEEYAEQIIKKIKEKNGQPIVYQENQIPLTLHIAKFRLEQKRVNYDELYAGLHNVLREGKNC